MSIRHGASQTALQDSTTPSKTLEFGPGYGNVGQRLGIHALARGIVALEAGALARALDATQVAVVTSAVMIASQLSN